MRVICPATAIHFRTVQSLTRFAPNYEIADLQGNEAYWILLKSLWMAGQDILIVEHDIEIHGGVIASLESCPEPWCVYAYQGNPPGTLMTGLGCTRFRAELLEKTQHIFDAMPRRHWDGLDSLIERALKDADYHAHEHFPAVLHHRVYGPPRVVRSYD